VCHRSYQNIKEEKQETTSRTRQERSTQRSTRRKRQDHWKFGSRDCHINK
jgi:hypothetical protein